MDCIGLIIGVIDELGLQDGEGNPLSRHDEFNYSMYPERGRLVGAIQKHLREVPEEKMTQGDVLLFRTFRDPQHVGLLTEYPTGGAGLNRQHDLVSLIHAYDEADNSFGGTMEKLMKVAVGAHKAFQSSNTEDKRELLNFVFSNLSLKGESLCYSYNFPFGNFENLDNCTKWRCAVCQPLKVSLAEA